MKQFFHFSLLLLALLLPATATAYDFEVDGIYYNIDCSNASVTFGDNEYRGSVTIPATVTHDGTTYSVTTIGDNAFSNCIYLSDINIPNSVTSIGNNAFYCCKSLTEINIPNSVTSIGSEAFYNCSFLTTINIPNSVTTVGRSAFSETGWYIYQPDGLVYAGLVAYIYKGTMPEGTSITLKEGTASITDYAFANCTGLTSIVMPNSLTEIGSNAFIRCTGLINIDIPKTITKIGKYAFYNTAWYNNQPDGLVYAGLVAYKYKGTMPNGTSMTIRNGTASITGGAFEYCTGLTSIVIPNSVTDIGAGAFAHCTDLASVNIPNSVTVIRGGTFLDCSSLTSIVIPNSVTSIAGEAFSCCTGLTSIVIPNSVTRIDHKAFDWCSGLTSIMVESGNPRYDSHNDCNAIIETASNTLIVGCKNTIIPNSVTEIGDYAFDGCTGLTSIVIPNSVTAIGFMGFKDCRGLTSIDIPNSVTYIGNSVFFRCSGLTSIVIPNSVTSIGYEAFAGCTELTDVYSYIADPSRVTCWSNDPCYWWYLYGGDYSGRTLHVLQGTGDAYRADKKWYPYFGQIVEDIFLGDVNRDHEVNIADVNAVIEIILGGNDDTIAADVNGDGEINIADINAVIDIILN